MSIKRSKYQPYIFNNGRVVLVEQKIIGEAISLGKEILLICNAWSGGYAHAIGANKKYDLDFGECWVMYGYDIEDKELDVTDLDKFYRVIISSGEQIWMESGNAANYYNNTVFIDLGSSADAIANKINCPSDEFYKIYKMRTTINPISTVRHLNYKCDEDHKPDYTNWEERIWALINIGILPKDSVKYMDKRKNKY